MSPLHLRSRGLILAAVVCLTWQIFAVASDEPTLTTEQIEQFLLTAKVVHSQDAKKGVTHTLRLTLSDGNVTHDASFQTIDVVLVGIYEVQFGAAGKRHHGFVLILREPYAGGFMADKMYWAARCKRCSGMVGYRNVRYALDARGTEVEEELPHGTTERRCDHCGTLSVFDLRHLRDSHLTGELRSFPTPPFFGP